MGSEKALVTAYVCLYKIEREKQNILYIFGDVTMIGKVKGPRGGRKNNDFRDNAQI